MRNILLAGAGAVSLMALPAALNAQDTPEADVAQPSTTNQSANEANAQAAPLPRTTTVTNQSGRTVVTRNNPGNLTPPPADAQNRTYPVCGGAVQDSCQNPGEGGAPGRSRALDHWPGEPASERSEGAR